MRREVKVLGSAEAGRIDLGLNINPNLFQRQLSDIASGAENSVVNAFKPIGKLIGSVLAVGAITSFAKSCLELGSDLTEVQNVVDTAFPTMNQKVNEFADNAMKQFGMSETVTKKYIGTLGAMSKSMGFSETAAYEMSAAVTGLAGDVASFYNLSTDEAFTKLKSIWTGETESLKEIGVLLTQTNLDQYALNNGFGKTTASMTEQEKVMLRYQYTMSALADASGDFAKTSGSWANQTRILSLQFDALKATLGQGFINLFTPIIQAVNSLIGRLQVLANYFKQFTEFITGNKNQGSSGGIASVAADADTAAGSIENMASGAKEAAKSLSGIDKLNVIADSAASGTGGSASDSTGIADTALDFGTIGEGNSILDETDERLSALFFNIQSMAGPTLEALKRLWTEGLSGLGNFTWTGLKDFYNGFLVPLGTWRLGEGLPRFLDAINSGLSKVDWEKINRALRDLWDVLTPFSINIGTGLLWLWENVLVPLGTWTVNEIVPRFLETLSISIGLVNTILEAARPGLKWFWDSILQPIAEWTGGIILDVWDDFNRLLKRFSDWCKENPEIIERVTLGILIMTAAISGMKTVINTVTGTIKGVTTAINLLANPVGIAVAAIGFLIAVGVLLYKNWDEVKEYCSKSWNFIKDTVSDVIDNIKSTIAEAIDKISTVWHSTWQGISDFFSGIWNEIKSTVTAVISGIKSVIGTVMSSIKTGIENALKSIKDRFKTTFESVKETVINVFKGMWNGVKSVINTMLGGIETMANGVVKGINKMINALNTLNFDIPDWVPVAGGKNFGFSIPNISEVSIPRLAEGGFVKPNTPQLAMIGDNRHQGEVVAPEDKLLEMAKLAAEQSGNKMELMEIILLLRELLAITKEISLKELVAIISSSEVYKAWKTEKNLEQKRTGRG